jgi:hypothetical protein
MAYTYKERAVVSRKCSGTSDDGQIIREFLVWDGATPVNNPEAAIHDAESGEFAYGTPHPEGIHGLLLVSLLDCYLETGSNICVLVVTYNKHQSPEYEKWAFDIGTDTRHITSVPNWTYVRHFPDFDYGLAINATPEHCEGVDVYRPRLSVTVSKLYASFAFVPWGAITHGIGTMNMFPWPSGIWWMNGQVLFLGARITPTGVGNRYNVDYQFLVGGGWQTSEVKLISGLTVYPTFGPWDYVWYTHGVGVGVGPGGITIPSYYPESVHVAQVYDLYNFNTFGLSGPV